MPGYQELSAETILDAGNRILSQHNLDMDLTPDACFFTGVSETFVFDSSTAREKLLDIAAIDDISRIIRIQSRTAGSTDEDAWTPETQGSYENWDSLVERQDRDFVAFYTSEDGLTMVVARDVSALEFRIVYKVLQDKITSSSAVLGLPSIYEPLLVYDLALEFGELIDNLSPEFAAKKTGKMVYLRERRSDAYNRVEKWRRSQKGAAPNRRRAFNDRSGLPNSDLFGRRRLF